MIRSFPSNFHGRDFVVGDIHGEYSMLERCLNEIDFDQTHDRLFCTGDLVDRGPESMRALEFLKKTWFFSVRGNHDMMPMAALRGLLKNDESALEEWVQMGGDWFFNSEMCDVVHLANAMMDLPILIEVDSPNGLIGITHAEPAIGATWNQLKVNLETGCHSTVLDLTWGRHRMEQIAAQSDLPHEAWSVSGVDHLFTGHTPMPRWFRVGNLHFIDTGACFNGSLTLVEVTAPNLRIPSLQGGACGAASPSWRVQPVRASRL